MDELRYVNKEKIDKIATLALSNKDILEELVKISISNDEYTSQHASLIIQTIVKKDSKIISPYIDDIIDALPTFVNNSQLSNFIETLEYVDFDSPNIYEFCFNLIIDQNRPGFVKINCVKMLGIAAKKDNILKETLSTFLKEKYNSLESSYLKKEVLIVLDNL